MNRSLGVHWMMLLCAMLIGGKVSATGVDLYVFAGQSNMLGAVSSVSTEATGPSLIPSPYKEHFQAPVTWAKQWNSASVRPEAATDEARNRFGTTFLPYHAGFSAHDGRPARWGPEVAFLWNRYQATGTPIHFLKYAIGGTQLYPDPAKDTWNAGAMGDNALLPALEERIRRATAALLAQGFTSVTVRLHWAQGESDAGSFGRTYDDNFTAMIDELQANLSAPNVIVALESMTLVANASTRNAQANINVAATREKSQVVNVRDYPLSLIREDNLHLNPAGQIRHGTEMELVSRTDPRRTIDRTSSQVERFTVVIPTVAGPIVAVPAVTDGRTGLDMIGQTGGLDIDPLNGKVSITALTRIRPASRFITLRRSTATEVTLSRLIITFVR